MTIYSWWKMNNMSDDWQSSLPFMVDCFHIVVCIIVFEHLRNGKDVSLPDIWEVAKCCTRRKQVYRNDDEISHKHSQRMLTAFLSPEEWHMELEISLDVWAIPCWFIPLPKPSGIVWYWNWLTNIGYRCCFFLIFILVTNRFSDRLHKLIF